MMRALDHVGLTVADLDRAVEFWCGRLGLQLLHRATETDPDIASLIGEDSAELEIADLDAGDGRIIELIKYIRIVRGEGPQLLFIVSLHDAQTQEPLASSTGPKITIWPDSTQGRQCSAWRAMISRSSSLMSSANVGRGALSRNTKVLISQECQVPDHGRAPRQFVTGGTGLGRTRTRRSSYVKT